MRDHISHFHWLTYQRCSDILIVVPRQVAMKRWCVASGPTSGTKGQWWGNDSHFVTTSCTASIDTHQCDITLCKHRTPVYSGRDLSHKPWWANTPNLVNHEMLCHAKDNDRVRSHACWYHGRVTMLTCMELWPDHIIRMENKKIGTIVQ